VIALATDYRIETATAFEVVVADATIDRVVAGAADQRILAAAAVQRVVSPLSIEVFDSAPAADRVVVLRAGDPFYAHDRCGTAEARPGPCGKVDRDGSDIARSRRDARQVEGVVPIRAVDVVDPVVAPEHLVRVHNAIGDPEFGTGQRDGVIALATVYRIETAAAFEVVVADAAVDRVVAGTADQRILAAAAVQRVVSPLSI